MSAGHCLHLSLGPVQGFVAEARRARDLWAGSFLLSWLTMRAIRAIDRPGVAIRSPRGLDRDTGYQALKNGGGKAPYRATIPNRLAAVFADEASAVAAAQDAGCAIGEAWRALAQAVHKEFLVGVLDDAQQAIWQAAIGPPELLWEIQWVVVPADEDGMAALEQRKLWRDFVTLPEAVTEGDRCKLMADWRELSGHSRVTRAGKDEQAAFWERLHKAYKRRTREDDGGRKLELRDGERLSPPALVKRLFSRLPVDTLTQVIGWAPTEEANERGRWRPSYMPSTAYMASVYWLVQAARLKPDSCQAIAEAVEADSPALAKAERETKLEALSRVGSIQEVDGSLFFADVVENAEEIGLEPKVCKRVADLLRTIYATKDPLNEQRPLGGPSPYYAVLKMDGDHMGELLRGNAALADALPEFARAARGIVEAHSGRLLYAGADDLLALLPLEQAIAAALVLEAEFRRLTAPHCTVATISAGLTFAHQNAPLRAVMAEGSRLLDEVAKQVNGRASFAVSVLRVGGPVFEWATTWVDRSGGKPVRKLQALLDGLASAGQPTRPLASNRLTYAMRDRLGPFFTAPGARRHEVVGAAPDIHVGPETLAELLRTAGGEALRAVKKEDLEQLLNVATIRYRQLDANDEPYIVERCSAERCLDLVLLFRFLGSQWRKR